MKTRMKNLPNMKKCTGKSKFEAVVIGCSTGGIDALLEILPSLPGDLGFPVLIVQHISPDTDGFLAHFLDESCQVSVKEAEDGEDIQSGFVYIAPANYHLLLEKDRNLSLSVDSHVNYSRPSIDVLFETASWVCQKNLVGILLTGASSDGSRGLRSIQEQGGMTVVQDPSTAIAPFMPQSALDLIEVDHLLSLKKISALLRKL
jgi:two-component system chemotaxis response regulator CheB